MNDVACVLTLDFAFRHGCPLRSLDLDDNGLGRDGARALACALASEACALERLEVRHEKRKKKTPEEEENVEKNKSFTPSNTRFHLCAVPPPSPFQTARPPV